MGNAIWRGGVLLLMVSALVCWLMDSGLWPASQAAFAWWLLRHPHWFWVRMTLLLCFLLLLARCFYQPPSWLDRK